MDERTFKLYMREARTMQSITPSHHELWHAYIRGLRRLFYGEQFGTNSEHEHWMHCGDRYPERERGYRAGFAGIRPMELDKEIK